VKDLCSRIKSLISLQKYNYNCYRTMNWDWSIVEKRRVELRLGAESPIRKSLK
jgi:hypothetical protein